MRDDRDEARFIPEELDAHAVPLRAVAREDEHRICALRVRHAAVSGERARFAAVSDHPQPLDQCLPVGRANHQALGEVRAAQGEGVGHIGQRCADAFSGQPLCEPPGVLTQGRRGTGGKREVRFSVLHVRHATLSL